LTSALDGGEWSDSHPGRITTGERAPGTHWIRGWVGPRRGVEKNLLSEIEFQLLGRSARSPEVHKIPARVQCTVQVCELAVSNQHPLPYRSRQIICLSHSESVRLPLQLPMRPSPHQLHAGPGRSIPCTRARHSSTHHRTLCTCAVASRYTD
jgi:hypothetical protein